MAQSHSQWQLQADILKLTGALDRDSVPALWAVAQKWQPSQTELECSLEEIERIDSANLNAADGCSTKGTDISSSRR